MPTESFCKDNEELPGLCIRTLNVVTLHAFVNMSVSAWRKIWMIFQAAVQLLWFLISYIKFEIIVYLDRSSSCLVKPWFVCCVCYFLGTPTLHLSCSRPNTTGDVAWTSREGCSCGVPCLPCQAAWVLTQLPGTSPGRLILLAAVLLTGLLMCVCSKCS